MHTEASQQIVRDVFGVDACAAEKNSQSNICMCSLLNMIQFTEFSIEYLTNCHCIDESNDVG